MRTTRLLADAERRGDLYTSVNLRASHPIAGLARGRRRRRLRAVTSASRWRSGPRRAFSVQHWQAMLWETRGRPLQRRRRARVGPARARRALAPSHLLSVQLMRAFTHFVRGRSAIASLEGLPEGDRGARLADARRSHELLGREGMPWTAPLAAILQACLANVAGDISRAELALRQAIERSAAAEMSLHADAARFRLGMLLGMLVRRDALRAAGGMAAIRAALIDDCALARALKAHGPIWIGLTERVRSIRAYPAVADIRRMVSRTAYAQLRYSPLLLAGTVLGLALTYLAPVAFAVFAGGLAQILGIAAWLLMALAFQPTLRFYGVSRLWGPVLPAIAAVYMAFTVDSAYQHARGRGGMWKGRSQADVTSKASDLR